MNDTQPKKKELKTREDALLALANSQEPLAIKLTNDFAFKKAFSNKKVMKGFLNALPLFKGIPIADIEFTNTFLSGDTLEDREGILDLRLRLANQTKINIEMQVEPFADWAERTLFYTSKMYTENFLHGQPYGMLEPCIHIGILHFSCMKSPEFYHVIHLCDEKTGEIYSDKMEFFVIELKKLETADHQEKQSELWKWAQLINTDDREVLQMLAKENEGMSTAVEEMDKINQSAQERYLYLRREMAVSDLASHRAYWEKKGEARGEMKLLELLTKQVKNKVTKGLPLMEIAHLLEEDEDRLQPIYDFIIAHPNMSVEELCKAFKSNKE